MTPLGPPVIPLAAVGRAVAAGAADAGPALNAGTQVKPDNPSSSAEQVAFNAVKAKAKRGVRDVDMACILKSIRVVASESGEVGAGFNLFAVPYSIGRV